jgi:hypothetical protein
MTVQDKPRGLSPWRMLAGHYYVWTLASLVALLVTDYVTRHRYWEFNGLTWAGVAFWLLVMFDAAPYHDKHLCERCISSAPLDPDKAVGRWMPALRWVHARPLLYSVAAAMAAWVVYATLFTSSWSPWWATAVDMFVVLPAITWMYAAQYAHRWLKPWCPLCNWGGEGGDHEAVPEPDPDPAASR